MALQKKFLFGVGDVIGMQDNNVVFYGKTLLDSGIEISTSSTEVRGGQGNQLQAIYYHTGTLNATITDTQFSLPLIALNTGASISSGGNVWTYQTITTADGKGTLIDGITNADVASIDGANKSVYVEYEGTYYTLELDSGAVTFTTTPTIPNGTVLCVAFLEVKNSAQSIIIPANIVPDRVRLYITANLSGDTTGSSGFIGTATVEIPIFQLSGAQTIAMTADGVANTPLSGMAIAYTDTTSGCTSGAYYAKITEDIFDTNWYDNATALAIDGGDFTMAASSTQQLRVWYVANGRSLLAPLADLTFSCTPTTSADVGVHTGLVTSTAVTGDGLISVYITNKSTIEASATVTVE